MTKAGILFLTRGFSVYVYIYKGTVRDCLKVGQVISSYYIPRSNIFDWKVNLATDYISAHITVTRATSCQRARISSISSTANRDTALH